LVVLINDYSIMQKLQSPEWSYISKCAFGEIWCSCLSFIAQENCRGKLHTMLWIWS